MTNELSPGFTGFSSLVKKLSETFAGAAIIEDENDLGPHTQRTITELKANILENGETVQSAEELALLNADINGRIAYSAASDVELKHLSAEESLSGGRGDCEDFSIAKRTVLNFLGIPVEDTHLLSMSSLETLKASEIPQEQWEALGLSGPDDVLGFNHMALAVRFNDEIYVLDNDDTLRTLEEYEETLNGLIIGDIWQFTPYSATVIERWQKGEDVNPLRYESLHDPSQIIKYDVPQQAGEQVGGQTVTPLPTPITQPNTP